MKVSPLPWFPFGMLPILIVVLVFRLLSDEETGRYEVVGRGGMYKSKIAEEQYAYRDRVPEDLVDSD